MLKKRLTERIKLLPSKIWTKITKIDELKGRWVVGLNLKIQKLLNPQ